jgi:triosephosphate isomerase
MNGNLALVDSITSEINSINFDNNVKVVICPSSPYLAALSSKVSNTSLNVGAQNISEYAKGAYTGEISADMLNELSINYAIVGHSERRSIFRETSTQVAHKVKAALANGITPILCIGESEAERMTEQTETVLSAQIQPVIDEIGIENFKEVVIAYEPVWAIGTGKTASPEMAQETHKFIREFLAQHNAEIAAGVSLLYGGSVNAANSEELFAQTDIDGGLIGGASLKVDEFKTICSAAKG